MAQSVGEILTRAKKAGASDVHITVGIPPKMRVNGKLVTMEGSRLMPADTMEMAIQVMSDKQKQYFEENGEVDLSVAIAGEGRCRVNVYKQKGSIAMAFRLIDTDAPSLERLGMPETVMRLCQKKHGLVLATGPAGSGKTTTLAAMIDRINQDREAHIITLEEPIEYFHQHKQSIVNQREIGLDSMSYANAVRAALREDPDVLLIGELCDIETVSAAITAAEAGCFVLSTFQTTGAVNTIARMIDAFLPYQQHQIRMQLANVLEAVVSQQLVPSLDGKERVAAFEVMRTNSTVRNLIREGKLYQITGVMQANRKAGMLTMDEALLQLVQDNRITKQMAVQFAQNPEGMAAKLFQ